MKPRILRLCNYVGHGKMSAVNPIRDVLNAFGETRNGHLYERKSDRIPKVEIKSAVDGL